ncbi:MAG: FAD-binding oxidoreductase [Proteobacteria bacterium]|nr:FAD-binding oxidoreductase [Pseudomonadota bacterium]MCP4918355.1 FAD-binding oxidoreductase [Pseudomonadota bacterium]
MSGLPYWLDPLVAPATPLPGDVSCDVVVVGAGLCGTSAALRLAQAGVDVRLLEARQVAMSATGRNAGFLLQGTCERYDRAVEIMGRDRARRIHSWTLDNHDRIAACIEEHGIECGYRRAGSLQLGGSALEDQELRVSAALLREDGFDAQLLEGDDVPQVFRGTGRQVAVHMVADGELDPARFVRGVAQAAQAAGATIHENTRVTSLDASAPGDVRVETEHGVVSASLVIVATNARASDLLPWFEGNVDPVRGQMLATAPLPRLFDRPIYANHGYDYWRQDEYGRVVLGGWRNLDADTEVGHAEVLNPRIQAKMRAFLEQFPWDQPLEITHQWSGIMGFSKDGLPLVGPAPSVAGAVVGTGFTGHGFGFAFLAGAALADLVLEGTHPFCDDLDPRRLS